MARLIWSAVAALVLVGFLFWHPLTALLVFMTFCLFGVLTILFLVLFEVYEGLGRR